LSQGQPSSRGENPCESRCWTENAPTGQTAERPVSGPRDEGSRWPEEDQAHELSHIVLQHTLRTIEKVGEMSS
jgi:hypothetical protein